MQDALRSPLESYLDQLQNAAGPPAISENAFALTGKLLSDRTTMHGCARIVQRDLGLTLRLLRVANSALFNHAGRTVLNVSHASALLGTDALSELLETVPRTQIARPARELVVLSQVAGNFAWLLMGRLEPRWSDDAFIAGLLRNLGEVMIAQERPVDYLHIVAASNGSLAGIRAASRSRLHFDFDELTIALLCAWSIRGAPALAAQSTPDALLAQSAAADGAVALAASLGHLLTLAYFRAEERERDHILKACWPALARAFRVREPQMADLCDVTYLSSEPVAALLGVTRDQLRLRSWIPAKLDESVAAPASAQSVDAVEGIESILRAGLGQGMDRAAWLPFENNAIGKVEVAGDGWGGAVLRELIHPRKPPFLLAFTQRQDVWIDFAKDDRFESSDLARELKPAAFFLLPVCEGRAVRGCLYFDWTQPPARPPEAYLAGLAALRDAMAT
jgi:hypothetical protein